MNDFKVDYHIHTTASDGKARPTEIVKQAKDLDYDIIAITDHDNVDGMQEAMIAAEALEIRVVPGVEIAVETDEGIGLHMLGYYIDIHSEQLRSFLRDLIERRKNYNNQLFRTLQNMGYDISESDVRPGKNNFIGKPQIAGALLRKGYITDERQAYGPEFLRSPQCQKIPSPKPAAADAIRVIKEAGGTAVLAHPIQTRGIGRPGSEEFFANIDKIIKQLKIQGLGGLECYHPDQNAEESGRFVELAEKYHLHITRGSDFHGSDLAEADETAEYR
ncbi:MAG: PHP domain-containing protein [Bacillota bacterium]|nr:PHP domain-containing protein [Bacillota bacterium]